jgi:transcriptional regulator GlxA family with amidase domain
MRHKKEEIRQMRNARKNRKRQQKSEIKRAKIVEDAVRDVRAEADQCKSQALKYNELRKKILKANNQLKRLFNDKTNTKVYCIYATHLQI